MYDFDFSGSYPPIGYQLVKIYQTDNRDYRFTPYEYAKSHGFNLDDYTQVAQFLIKVDQNDDSWHTNMLGQIWYDGNNGTLQQHFKMRSLSMSDIIEVDGLKHYVDTNSFVAIK